MDRSELYGGSGRRADALQPHPAFGTRAAGCSEPTEILRERPPFLRGQFPRIREPSRHVRTAELRLCRRTPRTAEYRCGRRTRPQPILCSRSCGSSALGEGRNTHEPCPGAAALRLQHPRQSELSPFRRQYSPDGHADRRKIPPHPATLPRTCWRGGIPLLNRPALGSGRASGR